MNHMLLLLVALSGAASTQEPIRVFISVDMEGIGGIAHSEMTSAEGAEYERGRKLMVGEVNAAIEGAREAGATDFLVNDSHGSMRNVKVEDLLPPVRLISNNSKALGMMEGISADFDAVFFIGFHSMEGEPGVMAHTGSGGVVRRIQVDGRAMSEGGLNARVAGTFGVPVALATGDEDFVKEIRTLVDSDLVTVPVKRAIRLQTAELLHPEECRRLIREGARQAIENLGTFRPTRPTTPTTVELTYKNPDLADIASAIPTIERVSRYAVRFRSDDFVSAYKLIRVLYRNIPE
ncbi:MAG TPA: M55 family metallopeptidase [Vicinamibacteria bacterium]|nr:M55 family metallopeptidase [Vicinamibacteria bacterium]